MRRQSDSMTLPLDEEPKADQGGLAALAGVPGDGPWLVARYAVAALFSLKSSLANSSVGRTLVVPTPYAVKMALVDAAFRAGLPDERCADLLAALARVDVRIDTGPAAVVTHTFVKVRQEPKKKTPQEPYIPSIAYREMAHCTGPWRWALNLGAASAQTAADILLCLPHVNYIGKRGGFIQFLSTERLPELAVSFTQPLDSPGGLRIPAGSHVAELDDFGPEASMDVLSTFGNGKPKLDKHRRFVRTIIPLSLTNTGPGFSEYRRPG